MRLNINKNIKLLAGGAGVLALAVIYFFFDPSKFKFFPSCPFLLVTGCQCPGCGSQRAVHHLLHGEFSDAWSMNPLLVCALPYLIIGFIFDYTPLKNRFPRFYKALRGQVAVIVSLVVVVLFWIGRNFI